MKIRAIICRQVYLKMISSPRHEASKRPLSYMCLPLQKVCSTRQLNVCPAIGDHPHLLCMQPSVTVQGLSGRTIAKSALYPLRMNPRLRTSNNVAGRWHISSTTRSIVSTPWLASSSIVTSENCTIGIPEAALAHPPCLSASARRKASRSAVDFIAGLHLMSEPRLL